MAINNFLHAQEYDLARAATRDMFGAPAQVLPDDAPAQDWPVQRAQRARFVPPNVPDEQFVYLTYDQALTGAGIGVHRRLSCMYRRRTDEYFDNGAPFDRDIEGACAELAASTYLGRSWTGAVFENNRSARFDAWDKQVRFTGNSRGGLRIDERDLKEKIDDEFVLVTGQCPKYWLIGLKVARQVITHCKEYKNEKGARYWIAPQEFLDALPPRERFPR